MVSWLSRFLTAHEHNLSYLVPLLLTNSFGVFSQDRTTNTSCGDGSNKQREVNVKKQIRLYKMAEIAIGC